MGSKWEILYAAVFFIVLFTMTAGVYSFLADKDIECIIWEKKEVNGDVR